MTDPVIQLENISKKYLIYHETQAAYSTLIDTLSGQAKNLLNSMRSLVKNEKDLIPSRVPEEFWALKDVSFTIHQGECVGIIGRNGAGKSTLLKILSRIVTPTAGKMIVRGRLASLLEVGTGFHQELSGRENIYLNGSLLGMSRRDISRKFDEIVAFSGVEKFLDTPVKRYSSGMYTRLGFSIAAHLEPDTLIIDEVLSVGDFSFQQKCFEKLDRLSQEGRTIIFVSHDVNSVLKLCSRAIYLQDGQVEMIGRAEDCATAYINKNTIPKVRWSGKAQCDALTIVKAAFINLKKEEFFTHDDVAQIEIEYSLDIKNPNYYILVEITDLRGHLIASSRTIDFLDLSSQPGNKITFTLDTNLLFAGEYTVRIKPSKVGHSSDNEGVELKLILYSKENTPSVSDAIWGIKLKECWQTANA